jgi:hypothetical protein
MSVKYASDSHGVSGAKQTSEWRIVLGSRPTSTHASSKRATVPGDLEELIRLGDGVDVPDDVDARLFGAVPPLDQHGKPMVLVLVGTEADHGPVSEARRTPLCRLRHAEG